MSCCSVCEYRAGDAGIKSCTFKDPLKKHAEAMRRIQARENEANVRITDAWRQKRKEDARKRAIMKAQGRKAAQ